MNTPPIWPAIAAVVPITLVGFACHRPWFAVVAAIGAVPALISWLGQQ